MGRSRVVARLGLAGCLALLGCSGEQVLGDYPVSTCDLSVPPARVDGTSLSIASFWGADSREADALQTLVDEALAQRFYVSTQQMRTRVEAQRRIDEAFEGRQLPDVFQVNGGSDVLRWVMRGPREPDICALDALRDEGAWDSAYFAPALEPLSCRGQLYALPVGIHHLNVLFYNQQLLAELKALASARGLTLKSPEELDSVAELVQQLKLVRSLEVQTASGSPLVPLALGSHDEWPLTIIAFEDVLLGLDAEAYEWLWYGGLVDGDSSRAARLRSSLADMLAVLRELHEVGNFEARSSWQAALRQVGEGEALMTITGDWGFAQLSPPALERVRLATFPGTTDFFVYTPDSFAVPRAPRNDGFPARAFLQDVVADPEVLIGFSNVKHSIPPRRDLSRAQLDALGTETLRDTYERFARCAQQDGEGCRLLLAVSGLGPAPGIDPCFDEMDALLNYAVTGESREPEEERACQRELPQDSAEAEQQLLDLLVEVASSRYAADCRE